MPYRPDAAQNVNKSDKFMDVTQDNRGQPPDLIEDPDRPTDQARFGAYLRARYPCVAIVTPEEDDALDTVLHAAIETTHDVLIWSQSVGVRDALLRDSPPTIDTEHPAAALYHLGTLNNNRRLIIMLDLV